jgi:hypothetical protein
VSLSEQVCSWTPRTRSGCRLGIQEALEEHPACGAGCSIVLEYLTLLPVGEPICVPHTLHFRCRRANSA